HGRLKASCPAQTEVVLHSQTATTSTGDVFFYGCRPPGDFCSFPTRRSSDLPATGLNIGYRLGWPVRCSVWFAQGIGWCSFAFIVALDANSLTPCAGAGLTAHPLQPCGTPTTERSTAHPHPSATPQRPLDHAA